MKKKRMLFSVMVALVAFLMFSANVSASLSNWGAETINVVEYAPSYWGGSNSVYASDGGQGKVSANSLVSDYRGNTESSAVLGLTPRLSSKAYVNDNSSLWGARGTAWAIEGYTYTGSVAKDFTLNVNIQGSLFKNKDVYPSQYGGGSITSDTVLRADVYVFDEANFTYSLGIGTLVYENGATVKGSVSFAYDQDGTYNESGQILFSVNPGESFYLWSKLETLAQWYPSYSDAGSTLTMSFADGSNLLQAASVPIPGALFLFAPGLAGLIAIRRRLSGQEKK
jgi:hypothetical protein